MAKSAKKASSEQRAGIVADRLTKRFGEVTAVAEVSFAARSGAVTALLGPNGAGKSTTMRLITGVLAPTSGNCRIAGDNITGSENDRVRAASHIGYLPENGPLYEEMTPLEMLRFFHSARNGARAARRQRIDKVIDLCALRDVTNRPIFKLSKGYRQRVGMAAALVHDPDVLVLDEPTVGLDPNQLREIRALIRELGKRKTVLFSTHLLQEVRAICDRVLLIDRGELVFDGEIDSLKKQFGGDLDDRKLEEWFEKTTVGAGK